MYTTPRLASSASLSFTFPGSVGQFSLIMSDQEPRILAEVVGHPPAGDGDDISASPDVSSRLEALTQSVERLVQSMAADADFDELSLLEEGEVFDPSLSVSGEHPSTSNTSETEVKVQLPDEDLLNSPETCGADISTGLATRIDTACTKKPAKEKLVKIQERYLRPLNCSHMLAPKVNPELWDDLSDTAKGRELGLQSLQKLFVKSFYPLTQLANTLVLAKSTGFESIPIGDIYLSAIHAVTLLGNAVSINLSLFRLFF